MTPVESLMRKFADQFKAIMDRPSLYALVLDKGRAMSTQPLTFGEARQIVDLSRVAGFRNVNSFERKQCYMTCQKLITTLSWYIPACSVEYCEGYVAWDGGPLPIDHAWLTINGKVVDVTLRAADKKRRHSYFGLVIPVTLLTKHMLKTGYYAPVIEGPFQHKVFPEAYKRRAR